MVRSTVTESTSKIWCGCVLALASFPCTAVADHAVSPSLKSAITVYVFNSADVPSRELNKAQEIATRVFEKSGITIAWMEGIVIRDETHHSTTEKWNKANLILRIQRSSTIRGKVLNSEAVGFCLSMEDNEAVLLFDAIKDRAASVNAQPAVALGISMAHELGHLLRQSTQHALAGVMKRRWLAEDLAAAEGGTLTFTREESESMRNRIERLHKSAEIDLPILGGGNELGGALFRSGEVGPILRLDSLSSRQGRQTKAGFSVSTTTQFAKPPNASRSEPWRIPIIGLHTCSSETDCEVIRPPFASCRREAKSSGVVGTEPVPTHKRIARTTWRPGNQSANQLLNTGRFSAGQGGISDRLKRSEIRWRGIRQHWPVSSISHC